MEKKINVVVTIDKTEMTEEEKIERLARYGILLHKWKQQDNFDEAENAQE